MSHHTPPHPIYPPLVPWTVLFLLPFHTHISDFVYRVYFMQVFVYEIGEPQMRECCIRLALFTNLSPVVSIFL